MLLVESLLPDRLAQRLLMFQMSRMLSVVVLMMMSIILILFAFFDDQERASNSLAYGKQLLTSAARSTFGGEETLFGFCSESLAAHMFSLSLLLIAGIFPIMWRRVVGQLGEAPAVTCTSFLVFGSDFSPKPTNPSIQIL